MANAYFGPGSGPNPYGAPDQGFYSAPTAQDFDRLRQPYAVTPYGPVAITDQNRNVFGRLPGQGPTMDAFGNMVGTGTNRLDPRTGQVFQWGQGQTGSAPASPWSFTGPGGAAGGGGAPFGAVTPGQLGSLLGPNATAEDRQGMQAAGMAMQEYERIPGVYQGDLAQATGQAIQRQLSGADAPFTPGVVDSMRGQFAGQASAAHRARMRDLGSASAARGMGGGPAAMMGSKLQSQEAAAKQRARQNTQLGITSQLENFASRERGRAAGADFLGQQARDMTPAILAKGGALANFQNFGQGQWGGLGDALGGGAPGTGGGGWITPGQGGHAATTNYGNTQAGGLFAAPKAPDPWEQSLQRMQQVASIFGMGGGLAQQAQQTQATGAAQSPAAQQQRQYDQEAIRLARASRQAAGGGPSGYMSGGPVGTADDAWRSMQGLASAGMGFAGGWF